MTWKDGIKKTKRPREYFINELKNIKAVLNRPTSTSEEKIERAIRMIDHLIKEQ